MLGISTACISGPRLNQGLAEFFKTSIEIGFSTFEIGVSSVKTSKKDILNWQKRLNLNIASVHNLFTDKPIDAENRRGDFLASSDEKRREETIKLTLKTAKFAEELGARAVILHAGYIKEGHLRENCRDFKESWSRGEEPLGLEITRKHLSEIRTKYAYKYVERVIRSLKTVCRENRKILFCLEPRVNFYEIPNLKETEEIFARVKEPNLCYWHDTGHAQAQENLGLSAQEDWLKTFGERMAGIHLHDTRLLKDHLPPGIGKVNFPLIKKYLQQETIKIIEVGDRATKEELKKSLIFLDRTGIA